MTLLPSAFDWVKAQSSERKNFPTFCLVVLYAIGICDTKSVFSAFFWMHSPVHRLAFAIQDTDFQFVFLALILLCDKELFILILSLIIFLVLFSCRFLPSKTRLPQFFCVPWPASIKQDFLSFLLSSVTGLLNYQTILPFPVCFLMLCFSLRLLIHVLVPGFSLVAPLFGHGKDSYI